MSQARRLAVFWGAPIACLLLLVTAIASCRPGGGSAPPPRAAQSGDSSDSEVLFDPAIEMISRLEDHVSTVEDEPRVVVSASTTNDGRMALGVIEADPAQEGSVFQVLRVVTNNARFNTNQVRPGDIVRYYAILEELQSELDQAQRFGTDSYVEFYVGEVLGENRIRLLSPLPAPIEAPLRVEIWRRNDEYAEKTRAALQQYETLGEPALGWEYSPERPALDGAMELLKSWANAAVADASYAPPELLRALSQEHREVLGAAKPGATTFLDEDGRFLQESYWLRNFANQAVQGAFGEVERAENLFTWCMRRVQLATDPIDAAPLAQLPDLMTEKALEEFEESDKATPERPWKMMLYGFGTVEQRAWVFTLAARQLGLQVVQLAIASPEEPPRYWCSAALIDDELYLLDPALGAPLRKADGATATLAEVLADPAILRGYDLPDDPYPVSADDLSHVAALVEASPEFVSLRMARLQKKLSGPQSLVLQIDADEFADRVSQLAGVTEVLPWVLPYESLRQMRSLTAEQRRRLGFRFRRYSWQLPPMMWKARLLDFKGDLDGRESAKTFYMASRPPNRSIVGADLQPAQRYSTLNIKRAAAFWLGQINLQQGSYRAAADFFQNQVLFQDPGGPWTYGAYSGLAETLEAAGDLPGALAAYEAGAEGPERRRMLLSAARIKQQLAESADDKTEPATEPTTDAATTDAGPSTDAGPDASES